MCNPPFYASEQDMLSSAESKSYVPFSACTGAAVEMIVAGGEVAFVTRMIEESRQLRHRVQWYSSMLGKLSSVTTLVELLIKYDNNNYAVTEFVQGSKTKRWALAWSWEDRRPSMVRYSKVLFFFEIPHLYYAFEYIRNSNDTDCPILGCGSEYSWLSETSSSLPGRFHIHIIG